MTLSPVSVESFGGLNLIDDPGTAEWGRAIDLLNVDLDKRGRVRSRDGFDNLTASAAAQSYGMVYGYDPISTSGASRHVLAVRRMYGTGANTPIIDAINTDGSIAASQTTTDILDSQLTNTITTHLPMAVFSDSGASRVYIGHPRLATGYYWNGSAFTGWSDILNIHALAVTPWDNRLVAGTNTSNYSRINFSDPGDPTTWGADNFVDMTPGDGEGVTALVAWRGLLFAFKPSSILTFIGTSTDGSGGAVFNERPVDARVGAVSGRAVAAARDGVYFLGRDGVYRTSGGSPELLSQAIEPIFRANTLPSAYTGSVINQAALGLASMCFHRERIYLSIPTGSSTYADTMLVYDPRDGTWLVWNIPAAAMTSFRVGNDKELVFAYATGSNHVGRHSPSYTDDDGVAITSRYRSGFSDLGTPQLKTVRDWRLEGSGTPTFKASKDFGSLDAGAAVTLGTAPAVAEARRRYAVRGRQFSWQIGGASAWSVNNVVAQVRAGAHPS